MKNFYDIDQPGPNSRSAYPIAFAENTQQVIRYQLYGLAQKYISEKVLTPRDVGATADVNTVKLHLGLTSVNSHKSLMEL
jgi:hypothetical protein